MADDITINIGARDSASAVLKKAQANVTKFGQGVTKSLKESTRAVASYAASWKNLAGVIAGAAIVRSVRQEMLRVDDLAKFSRQINISIDGLQALQLAASEISGASIEMTNSSLQRFQRRIGEAARTGRGELAPVLQQLGIDAQQLARMPLDQALGRFSDKFREQKNAAGQASLAQAAFGREGLRLINLLRGGTPVINQYQQAIKDIGASIDDVDAQKIEEANDAIARLQMTIRGLSTELTVALAPGLQGIVEGLQFVIDKFNWAYERARAGAALLGVDLATLVGKVSGGELAPTLGGDADQRELVMVDAITAKQDKKASALERQRALLQQQLDLYGKIDAATAASVKQQQDRAVELASRLRFQKQVDDRRARDEFRQMFGGRDAVHGVFGPAGGTGDRSFFGLKAQIQTMASHIRRQVTSMGVQQTIRQQQPTPDLFATESRLLGGRGPQQETQAELRKVREQQRQASIEAKRQRNEQLKEQREQNAAIQRFVELLEADEVKFVQVSR